MSDTKTREAEKRTFNKWIQTQNKRSGGKADGRR